MRTAREKVLNSVRELRTHTGGTQKALGIAVGVSRQTIIAIEAGRHIPSVLLAMKISAFFKMPVEKVFLYRKKEP